LLARPSRFRAIVTHVRRAEEEMGEPSLRALGEMAPQLRIELREKGFQPEVVGRVFAVVRALAGHLLGERHYDVQLLGGWALLNGTIAEMATGEGKTLTATLPASAAALAGIPVHIITVNDYLATRDAQWMGPIFAALGLTVGVVTHESSPGERIR